MRRIQPCRDGGGGKGEDREVPIGHGTEFGFHSKYKGNPLESFGQKGDMT